MILSCFTSIVCFFLLSIPILCRRLTWPAPPTLKLIHYSLTHIKGRCVSPRPKRPLTALFRFYMDNRDKLRDEHPGLRRQYEVVKLATAVWYGLPAEMKKPYEDQYAEEMKEYSKAIVLYKESLSPKEAEGIKELRQMLNYKKQVLKLENVMRHLNRPKPPMNKFLLFCKEQIEKELPYPSDQIVPELLRKYGEMWKEMSNDEKRKYEEQFRHLQKEYQEHMSKWEEEMIKQSPFDVIRKKSNVYSHVELKNDSFIN